MPEILQTNFPQDQEKREPTIVSEAPYTIFEPAIEHISNDGKVEQLSPVEVFQQIKGYTDDLTANHRFTPGITIPLDSGSTHTLGEVVDTKADSLLTEARELSKVPEAIPGILTTIAKFAEHSGFDRDKATFGAALMYAQDNGNPNLNLHADGLFGLVTDETKKVKAVRFVYAIGPGTLIYPNLDKQGSPMQVDYDSPTGVQIIENPTDLQSLNAPRGATFSEQEIMNSNAQQVRPGYILGFDPTRTFWHQAPDEDRPILAIDIKQAE